MKSNHSYIMHQWMTKTSAPSDAGSDQKVKMEDLAQRTIGSENNINQIPTHITEPPPINGREYFLAAADKLAKENSARNASDRSMSSPVSYLQMIIIRAGVSAWIVLKKAKY
jgi:hypothetical protein